MGKDTEKNSAQRLFAGLFLFEVYYCPMLFSKNIINIRKTLSLFGILHSRKIEILNLKRLLLLKKRFKTRKIAVLV